MSRTVKLRQPVLGHRAGDTVTTSDEHGEWLSRNGYAIPAAAEPEVAPPQATKDESSEPTTSDEEEAPALKAPRPTAKARGSARAPGGPPPAPPADGRRA